LTGLIRFGVSISEELLEKFDGMVVQKGYNNRSEAIRDLIRNQLVELAWQDDEQDVAGTITLIYDHHVRSLSKALLDAQHNCHHLILSTMHLHLDHHNCLEVLAVKGLVKEIRDIAQQLIGVRGVKHGRLTITSTGKNLE